jgi:hypothetical protein
MRVNLHPADATGALTCDTVIFEFLKEILCVASQDLLILAGLPAR